MPIHGICVALRLARGLRVLPLFLVVVVAIVVASVVRRIQVEMQMKALGDDLQG